MARGMTAGSCLGSDSDDDEERDDEEDKDDEEDDEDDVDEDELDKCLLSWPSTVLSATILQAPNPLPSLSTTLTS